MGESMKAPLDSKTSDAPRWRFDRPIQSLLEAVGGSPLVELQRLAAGSARVLLKLEHLSPGGSIKDRIAVAMIRGAEERGELAPGGTVIEPTSGNTGIGLAWVAACRGYRCILTMPADMSLERRALLQSYGAELVLTDPSAQMSGAIEAAEDLCAATPGAYMPRQFENPDNPRAHAEGTALELLDTLNALGAGACQVALVIGVGTGGTLRGVAPLLRERFPSLRVIAVEPSLSPVLSGGEAGVHRLQGLGAGFVPPILEPDPPAHFDEIVQVDEDEAFAMRGRLAREEGIFMGLSTGANLVAALKIAEALPPAALVLTFGCDSGERYFSMDASFQSAGAGT